MTKKVLKGKRAYLRAPEPGDCEEYTAISRRSAKFHRGLIKMSRTREEFDGFLERSINPANANFLICRVSDDAIAGMINLSQIFYGPFCNAYLGYGLGVGFTGQGLMSEAVALILKHAFIDLKLHRVEANVQPENLASIAVLKRNGFKKEGYSENYLKIGGRWRDHERWAITRENWKR
jgi:[ribosomal protein S5]-alanine N-acetyltransferase